MTPNDDRQPRGASDLMTPGFPDVRGCPPGTIILTRDGEIPVEYLTTGDSIITRRTGYATLLGLDRHCLLTGAVWIAANAFGPSRPTRDIILPDAQKVLLRDQYAMSRASALVDGRRITRLGPAPHHLLSLWFADAQVIYADGLELACAASSTPGRQAA